jgi:hypothetical protein
MRSETEMGFDEWFPRRAVLLTASGMWAAGFALGGASAVRMQQTIAGTDGTNEAPTSPESTPVSSRDQGETDAPGDTAESEAAVYMAGDVIVGGKSPRAGATQMQKR